MLLAPVPWAERVRALSFLTALVPSERYNASRGRRHKTLLDLGRQLAPQARRWLPDRDLVLVADSSFASLLLLHAFRRHGLAVIMRLHLDAALCDPTPTPRTGHHRPPAQGRATPAKIAVDSATRRDNP